METTSNVNFNVNVPVASTFVSSPLRNRISLELDAPVTDVWSVVGDLSRFPEYSTGLEKVDATKDSRANYTAYVCHFKRQEESDEGMTHRESVCWYEPNRGWASIAEEPNAFGLTNSLTLVTVESTKQGSILTWDQHFDAEDVDMNKAIFDQALADIGENLVTRFGGRWLTGKYSR